jgi:hypothetical protein
MKQKLLTLVFCAAAGLAVRSPAITLGPFGPHGEGGTKNGQTFTIGTGGTVFELDGFLKIGGLDLNGAQLGTSAQLSRDSLPAGLVYQFTNKLAADKADVTLTYSLSNTTSTVFTNVRFFVMLDAEIDQTINTFFNEYGTVKGSPGGADGTPDQWQIDEPGFATGTLYRNLFLGSLNNSNSIPPGISNDVAMAVGFSLGDLAPGASSALQVMISENGRALGSLSLVQRDSDPASKTFITLSGGRPPQLQGVVFVDANTNGLFDPGEGLTNVTVLLLSNGVAVAHVATDTDGNYSFAGAAAGTYAVSVDTTTLPPGLTLVPVQNGATSNPMNVRLAAGVSQVLNWAYGQPELTGTVFVDTNTNGVPDPGEGLANVTLLLQSGGTNVLQTTTDAAGKYHFGSAPSGSYSLLVDLQTLPSGLTLVPVQNGASANPTTVTLAVGVPKALNWGYARTDLHGWVFVDANTNGVIDPGEGLTNVTLRLLSGETTVLQVTTDAQGKYSFGSPSPGSYAVLLDTNTLRPSLAPVPVQNGATSNPSTVTLVAGAPTVLNWGYRSVASPPTARAQFHFIAWQLNRATGSLLGTLTLSNTNAPGGGPALEPFWLGLHASSDFFYPHPTGTSDLPYLDLTPAAKARLGGGTLNPGQTITLTNGVEVYSRTRVAPADTQFDWVPRP